MFLSIFGHARAILIATGDVLDDDRPRRVVSVFDGFSTVGKLVGIDRALLVLDEFVDKRSRVFERLDVLFGQPVSEIVGQ
jgi:hypothetical protein